MNGSITPAVSAFKASSSQWLNRRRAFGFLAGYFILQTLFRTVASSSAELDESEQLLWTQAWQWGYGSDPPLYTWLQILVFQAFGTGIFGLALLKNTLLFSAFVFTYLAADEAAGDERIAIMGMLSLFLFPQITWESQRDLTHSVLATALAAGTFYLALRLWRKRRPLDYLLLGVCIGLGTLSKYSYCLVVLALGLGALTVPTFRAALMSRWMLLTLAAWVVITAPHFQWFVLSSDIALSRTEQVVRSSTGSFVGTRALGLLSILKCGITICGALGLVYGLAFRKVAQGGRQPETHPLGQWVIRTLLVVFALCVMLVLATGIELRDRWFQPIVFLLAIWAAVWFQNELTPAGERRFTFLTMTLATIALVVLPAIPLSASITRRPTRLNAPYSALAAALRRQTSAPDVIVAANRLVGGNLRLFFPKARVVAPEFNQLPLSPAAPGLAVWDASKSAAAPAALTALVEQLRGTNGISRPPEYVEAPYLHMPARTMRLGYVRLAHPAAFSLDPR
jgi:4-amino-4-deoxy-L-arabinose transferase-like glycosyltransferase